MPLTETAIKKAKPQAKQRKLFGERGLFLLMSSKRGKWWRSKYSFGGKEKLLSLGTYPDVSLKTVRDRSDEARKQVADGVDSGAHRKAAKAASAERGEAALRWLVGTGSRRTPRVGSQVMATESSGDWNGTSFLRSETRPLRRSPRLSFWAYCVA